MTDGNIRAVFGGAEDFVARELRCGGLTVYAYFIDGITAGGNISEYVFKPLYENTAEDMQQFYAQALSGGVYGATVSPCADLVDAAMKLVNAFVVVLFPGAGAVAYEMKTPVNRSPGPPEVENTVKGPKDSFVENIRINTSLIRRHLRSPDLRLHHTTVGRRSLTNVTIVYMEGLTNPALVEQMKARLDSIDADGLLAPAAVEEYVTGSRATAFPLIQYTERSDKFCQGILDGRVGLLVDGLPLAYLAPVDLRYLMESAEDLGRDYLAASCIRILRYLALAVGLLLPGIYIALATYHQAVIPLPLLRSIIESKADVPFSTVTEILALLIAFELLQESGVHLPQAVGQSVSVIGGIVMGTAAVEAGLISPVALICVSITGICGFVQPNRDLAEAVRLWRFVIAGTSALAGIAGTAAGLTMLLIHLGTLRSLGIPYLSVRGGLVRRRFRNRKYRDGRLHPLDRRNQK